MKESVKYTFQISIHISISKNWADFIYGSHRFSLMKNSLCCLTVDSKSVELTKIIGNYSGRCNVLLFGNDY